MNTKFLLFISLNLIFSCLCKLENGEVYDLILTTDRETEGMGRSGVIAFRTNSSTTVDIFDESDIEKQIFDSKLILKDDTSLTPDVKCSLWKPKFKCIYILCNLQQELSPGEKRIKLKDYILQYKDKKIKIFSQDFLGIVIMSTKSSPFLYADEQIIDFNDGKDVYELKFKIKLFNEGDSLNLVNLKDENTNYINIRNDCSIKENELICKINKANFEGYLTRYKDKFYLKSFGEGYGIFTHELVFEIQIRYNVNKENIKVKITKLLNGIANNGVMASYETNITKISPCATKPFDLSFTLDGGSNSYKAQCFLKKYKDDKPLILLCPLEFSQSGKFTLSPTKSETKLEDINQKYLFILSPIENAEKINYSTNSNIGGIISLIHPNILDFTKKDSYMVVFGGDNISNLRGLVIEPSLKELECKYNTYDIECTIPKSYFKDQKNGYYYAYQNNHENGKSPCYEVEPIKIIQPDDSKSFAEKLNIYGYIFVLLMAFTLI